jgi:hypothetical protein
MKILILTTQCLAVDVPFRVNTIVETTQLDEEKEERTSRVITHNLIRVGN